MELITSSWSQVAGSALRMWWEGPMDVGNLISGSSVFSESSLYIWKFLVHIPLKPSVKAFDCYLANT